MDPRSLTVRPSAWLDSYKSHHSALLASDPEFRHWLDTKYKPIAGGWQY